MGCQCTKNTGEAQSEIINSKSKEFTGTNLMKNSNNNIDLLKSSISASANCNTESKIENNIDINGQNQEENYSEKMFEIINKIRDNPPLYAKEIENSIENIWEEKSKSESEKMKIVYKQRVKVLLNRGEEAFKEAAKELKETDSLPLLVFKNEICIPLPEKEEDLKNSDYLKEQVKLIRKNNNINVFYRDLIQDPEVSALLMVVDDNTKSPGKKRQAILDKNFKYIGVSSGFVGKRFIAYFSFSK